VKLRFKARDFNEAQLAALRCRATNLLCAGGYGSGKTTIGAAKIMQLSSANPGVPGLVIGQSLTAIRSTILTALAKFMPNKKIPKVWESGPDGRRFISFDGGHTPIYVRSASRPDLLDGLDVGWIVGDEARYWPRAGYDVALGRIRVKCPYPQFFLASTPAVNWLAEEYDAGKPNRPVITMPTWLNQDNLRSDYIDELRTGYSLRLQKAVIEGRFTVLEGAVFDKFDPDPGLKGERSPWVIDYDFNLHGHKKTFLFIDPGYRRPAVVWVRELAPLQWVAFHQDMTENIPMTHLVDRINRWNLKNQVQVDEVWVDPAALQKDQASEIDVLSAMREIDTRRRRPIRLTTGIFASVAFGIERVRVMLGDPEIGQPIRLKFSRELYDSERRGQANRRGVIKSLQSYAYPDIKEGRVLTDMPIVDPLHSHAVDAVRYGCVGLMLTTPALRASVKEARNAKNIGVKTA
jgi:hypothetical protein